MLNQIHTFIYTPIGASIVVGIVVMIYLYLMAFSVYLPPILLLSIGIGTVVYQAQTHCQRVGGDAPHSPL